MTSDQADPATPVSVREELFGREHRPVTVGLVLLISLVAFENMGVSTAMPALVADLASTSDYAWPFVAFVASSVLATVVGGRWCDRVGPRTPLRVAPLVFGAGLVVAGTAGSFVQLLAGRVLQGAGAGVLTVAVYVMIAAVYPALARPAVFGLISSAWVVPSLVGPPVAGLVTDAASWHWVFLGLLPLVVVAVALVVPATRRLESPATDPRRTGSSLLPAAVVTAAGVATLSWAGQDVSPLSLTVGALALVVLVPAYRHLVPAGTLTARRGTAAVVAGRGLVAGSFFTGGAFLPLALTEVHGWSLTAAGLPLVTASVGWSASAAWQARHPRLPRPVLLRVGFSALAAGTAGLLLVVPGWGLPWLAVPVWTVAGLGMGLAFSSLSALLLAGAAADRVGAASSAAQVTDGLAQALFLGLGGALLALAASTAAGLTGLVVVLTCLAVLGAVLSPRTAPAPGLSHP